MASVDADRLSPSTAEGPAVAVAVSEAPTGAPNMIGTDALPAADFGYKPDCREGTVAEPLPHPVLCKVAEAVKLIVKGSTDAPCAFSDNSVLLRGKHGCFAHLDYDKRTGGILANFVAPMDWRKLVDAAGGKTTGWRTPGWALQEEIKVHGLLHEMLDSLLNPGEEGGQLSLLQAGAHLSDGYIPRRITCTGFGVGGALATLGACWAAGKFATADVRCITLGSPCVGNKAFKKAFENLVGATYRVVLEGDAVAMEPQKEGLFKKYVPIGHTLWLHHGQVLYQEVGDVEVNASYHSLEQYISALKPHLGNDKHLRNMAAAGGSADKTGKGEQNADAARAGGRPQPLPKSVDTNLKGRYQDDFELDESVRDEVAKVCIAGKASQASLLAMHAYRDQEEFRAKTGLKHARLLTHKEVDTQVHVAWLEGGTAVFAFRGTESFQDAKVDADFLMKKIAWMTRHFPNVRAHRGFLKSFAGVCDPAFPERNIGAVMTELSGRQEPTRVLCCGHSLGGALATLAAVWASFEYPRADIRCVTLGSPRVGNAQFSDAAKYLIGSSYRLMHAWDPIPTVPPPQYLKHVKGRFWLRGDKAKDTKRPWFTKYFGFAAKATDHVMKSYTGQLASITGKEMVAEELGLGPGTGAGGDARPAAQDQGGDGDGEDDEPHVFNTAQVPVGGGIVDSGDES